MMRLPAMTADTPDLKGCEAKFRRGKAHAEELRAKIRQALDSYTYPVSVKRDEDARKYVFYVQEVPGTDAAWSLIFGDAIHNFRATLDHLAVQLAILGKGSALTEEEIGSTSFPVFDDPRRWEKVSGPSAVRLLRSGERERIRELQPFNALDRSIWGRAAIVYRGAAIPRLIEALHRADIADKHRFVHPSWYAVKGVDLPPVAGVSTVMAEGQRLEPDAELGAWSYTGEAVTLPDLPSDLDISRYFPLGIEFDYFSSMLDFIDEAEGLVARIIELFRPALTSGDPTPPVTTLL
jgi:hypothetical protein